VQLVAPAAAVAAAPAQPPADPPAPKVEPPPAAAGEPEVLKHRWVAELEPKLDGLTAVVFDREARAVVIASTNQAATAAALRVKDGSAAPGFPLPGNVYHLFPMTRGRVGANGFAARDVLVWEVLTGKRVAAVPVPEFPRPPAGAVTVGGFGHAVMSPDGRYLVAAGPSWYQDMTRAVRVPGPTMVVDGTANKTVLNTGSNDATFHFTADSSRLLIAEWTGRFRWFKLPSGQLDGEWQMPPAADAQRGSRAIAVAASGSVILYSGPTPDQPEGVWTLDGRTGKVLHRFDQSYHFMHGAVSDDGRRVALAQSPLGGNRGNGAVIDVLDAHTGARIARANPSGDPEVNYALPALSPDGRSLVAVYKKKVFLYDLPGAGTAVAVRPDAGPDPLLNRPPANPDPVPKTTPPTDPVPKVNLAPPPDPAPREKRLPAPAGDALARAEANVRTVLKDDYARKQPAERKTLAQKLITLAEGTGDDPDARYVMLRDARDFAAEVADPLLAIQAIDALAKWYDVDPTAAKVAALEKVLSASSNNATVKVVNDLAAAGADAAFDADDYTGAAKLAQVAATAARKGGLGPAAIEDAEFRLAHLKKTRDAFDTAQPALERLKIAPDDPDANLVAGKFRCFVQGRWADGAKMLAKGSSPALKPAAELELAAPPSGPADVKVADAWWDFAQAAPDAERRPAEARARYWYGRAVPGLTGLARAKVEGRLGFTHNNVEYKPGLLAEFTSKQASVLRGKKARIDAVIDYSAADFADPAKQADVSVRWTGVILPPRPGRYKLVASGTDPVRVRADGKTVIDTITNRNAKREGSVLLPDRPAQLVVEFTAPNTAAHTLRLSWVPSGGAGEEGIPAEALFHDRKAEAALGK
jgi:hypothetical protein